MKKVFLFLTTLISLSALTIDGSAQIDRGELGSLTTVKDGLRSRRISSADKTGNNGDCVGQFKPGEKWSVEIPGTGVINQVYHRSDKHHEKRSYIPYLLGWKQVSLCRSSYRCLLRKRLGREI